MTLTHCEGRQRRGVFNMYKPQRVKSQKGVEEDGEEEWRYQ